MTTKRVRDPVHGLIVFDEAEPTDMLAWNLIRAPEFQRLRRIKQLGVSELVYPGATHSRLSHSIGVYHNARRLMAVIRRAEGAEFNGDRAHVALIAALLHDLGHGPFSHAFEGARKNIAKARGAGAIEKHEKFTADMIQAEDGGILPLLGKQLADQVAALIRAEYPSDIYHAVVSSSFDADRLDYLVRDRTMTGTGAGAIDVEWLIDNLDVHDIPLPQDDDPEERWVPTFVFKAKGRVAAEDFLLARYRLYTQVYLHKTTRGFEQLVQALLRRVGELSAEAERLGLDAGHPLICFLRPDGGLLSDYRELDDSSVWGIIDALRRCDDSCARDLAKRLWHRQRPFVLDVSLEFGHDSERFHNARRRVADAVGEKLGRTVFMDEPSYSLYAISTEQPREHNKVRVRTGDGGTREIIAFADAVISKSLATPRKLSRFYFLNVDERDAADKIMRGR